MYFILLKATGVWLLIVIAAVINGVIREILFVPMLGIEMALPLSGIVLSIIIFLFSLLTVSFIGASETKIYLFVGMYWMFLTLSFEFLFGHYIAEKSWHEIMQVFDILGGNLFILVLLVTTFSPWVSAKIKGVARQGV